MTDSEELSKLRNRAKLLGIKHYHVMSEDSLKEKIQLALLEDAANDLDNLTTADDVEARRKEMLRLVRCRITNMNPACKDIPGTVITVHSDTTGTVKKFIPFDPAFSMEGYHIPNIILNYMKEKTFLSHTVKKRKLGVGEEIVSKWIKEYAIEELPPLTYEELSALAQRQQATQAVE